MLLSRHVERDCPPMAPQRSSSTPATKFRSRCSSDVGAAWFPVMSTGSEDQQLSPKAIRRSSSRRSLLQKLSFQPTEWHSEPVLPMQSKASSSSVEELLIPQDFDSTTSRVKSSLLGAISAVRGKFGGRSSVRATHPFEDSDIAVMLHTGERCVASREKSSCHRCQTTLHSMESLRSVCNDEILFRAGYGSPSPRGYDK